MTLNPNFLVIIFVAEVPLPEPVLLPCCLVHFIDGNALCLRKHEGCKTAHHNDPCGEEEESRRSHGAEHGQEHLSDEESAEHVHANCEEETGISCFQREYLAGDEPT